MFFLLESAAYSHDFIPEVLTLTDSNFQHIVDKRPNTTVFIVMFHGDRCPACQQSYPYFEEGAEEADGLVRFAHVDTSQNYKLSQRFQIRAIPTFIIFHSKGQTVYNGNRSPRSFIAQAASHLVDLSKKVNDTWVPHEGAKEVILFSSKPRTPPLWAGISCNLSESEIQVGFTNDESLLKEFNVTKTPEIIFINENRVEKYDGKNSYGVLLNAINQFFYPKPKKGKTTTITAIDSESAFKQLCKGVRKFCVFEATKEATPEFTQLATKFRNDPFQFSVCGNNCPMDEMIDGYWIFHTKREQGIYVKKIEDLPMSLEHIIDGTPKWKPMSQLMATADL